MSNTLASREFWLPGMEPLSINSTYILGRNGVTKSTKAKEWTQKMCHNLAPHVSKLRELRALFDEEQHSLHFEIVCVYSKDKLYTKKGDLSSRTLDVSNTEKSLIDVFCLKKFSVEAPPYGIPNLMCDDRFVTQLHSTKTWGAVPGIFVRISLAPHPLEFTL